MWYWYAKGCPVGDDCQVKQTPTAAECEADGKVLNEARSYLEDRYEWSVSEKSDDVCAVYETKKGAVKAKFNGEGKCTVIWMDSESAEKGKFSFIAKK